MIVEGIMTISANIQLRHFGSGAAGTKEWLASSKDIVIVATDMFVLLGEQYMQPSILSSEPLTPSQLELGKKIAKKHGLTK